MVKSLMNRVCWALLCLLPLANVCEALNTVLYGPSAREMLVLTAKVAAREGLDASLICAPGTEEGCQKLMYGPTATPPEGLSGRATPVSSGDDMQGALEKADALVFVALDTPIEEASYKTLLNSAGDNLEKVVLLSRMGVSKAGSGGFFGGGKDAQLKASEDNLKNLCNSRGLPLSIVRAGVTLKGGGPGEEGEDHGLDRNYYNTLLDVVEASVTIAHDKYTLGLDCTKGDTVEVPNMFTQMGSKSSFEACAFESNRVVLAGGTVAALLHDEPVEISVSSAKAEQPPSQQDWKDTFAKIGYGVSKSATA